MSHDITDFNVYFSKHKHRAHAVNRHFCQWRKYSEIGYKKNSVGEISDYRVKKGKKKRLKFKIPPQTAIGNTHYLCAVNRLFPMRHVV